MRRRAFILALIVGVALVVGVTSASAWGVVQSPDRMTITVSRSAESTMCWIRTSWRSEPTAAGWLDGSWWTESWAAETSYLLPSAAPAIPLRPLVTGGLIRVRIGPVGDTGDGDWGDYLFSGPPANSVTANAVYLMAGTIGASSTNGLYVRPGSTPGTFTVSLGTASVTTTGAVHISNVPTVTVSNMSTATGTSGVASSNTSVSVVGTPTVDIGTAFGLSGSDWQVLIFLLVIAATITVLCAVMWYRRRSE